MSSAYSVFNSNTNTNTSTVVRFAELQGKTTDRTDSLAVEGDRHEGVITMTWCYLSLSFCHSRSVIYFFTVRYGRPNLCSGPLGNVLVLPGATLSLIVIYWCPCHELSEMRVCSCVPAFWCIYTFFSLQI